MPWISKYPPSGITTRRHRAKRQRISSVAAPRRWIEIGRVGILDLSKTNSKIASILSETVLTRYADASPAQLLTALSHVAHLLVLSTHYLPIRLPAEITLPHRDHPLPTILSPVSAYRYTDVLFPARYLSQRPAVLPLRATSSQTTRAHDHSS